MKFRFIFTLLLACTFVFTAQPSFAQQKDVNRQTWFNDFTDYFAGIGKSEREKKRVFRDRQRSRRQYRIRKRNSKRRTSSDKRRAEYRKRMDMEIDAVQRAKRRNSENPPK